MFSAYGCDGSGGKLPLVNFPHEFELSIGTYFRTARIQLEYLECSKPVIRR
jgi:hypothetical protein